VVTSDKLHRPKPESVSADRFQLEFLVRQRGRIVVVSFDQSGQFLQTHVVESLDREAGLGGLTIDEISLLPPHEDELGVQGVEEGGIVFEGLEDRVRGDPEEGLSFTPVAQVVEVRG